jgi:AcrR family transcriptional regulator
VVTRDSRSLKARSADRAPRKSPAQERSRATVERIVEAAGRVVVAHGYHGASTVRIAAEAGVSPGSLYQYFPNKDAIILALVDRTIDELTARFAAQVTGMLDAQVGDLMRTAFGALVDVMSERAELVRAIVEIPPHGNDPLAIPRQRATDLIRIYLLLHRDTLRIQNIDALVWVIEQVSEALLVRYVLDQPPIPRDEFVAMTADLAVRFVLAEPDPATDK